MSNCLTCTTGFECQHAVVAYSSLLSRCHNFGVRFAHHRPSENCQGSLIFRSLPFLSGAENQELLLSFLEAGQFFSVWRDLTCWPGRKEMGFSRLSHQLLPFIKALVLMSPPVSFRDEMHKLLSSLAERHGLALQGA